MKQNPNTQATETIVPAQISFTIILQPWVSLAQFKALQQVVLNGLDQYGYMVASYTNNDVPPGSVTFPAQIVFQGVDPVATQAQIEQAIADSLANQTGFVSVDVQDGQ